MLLPSRYNDIDEGSNERLSNIGKNRKLVPRCRSIVPSNHGCLACLSPRILPLPPSKRSDFFIGRDTPFA